MAQNLPPLVIPLSLTSPGLAKTSITTKENSPSFFFPPPCPNWNGSLRAQVIVRLFARWCLSLPLQLNSHINVVLIDAMIDAKGFVSCYSLAKQLGLLHWSQVYEVLFNNPSVNAILTDRTPLSEEALLLQKIQQQQQQSSNNNNNSLEQQHLLQDRVKVIQNSNNSFQQQQQQTNFSNSSRQFSIDYRKALPHAYANFCYYFMNLLSQSKETEKMKHELNSSRGNTSDYQPLTSSVSISNVLNDILHPTVRTIKCFSCSGLLVWAENDAPLLKCPHCFSENVCVEILKTVITAHHEQQRTLSNPKSVSITRAPLIEHMRQHLNRQSCYGALLEQASLFLQLFHSKFVLISRSGAPVVHPDRVYASEEFTLLMQLSASGSSSFSGTNCTRSFSAEEFDSNVDELGDSDDEDDLIVTNGELKRRLRLSRFLEKRNKKLKERKLQRLKEISRTKSSNVIGVATPQFVEPPGVLEDWLPGLKIKAKFKSREDSLKHEVHFINQHQTFPPWLRDEEDEHDHEEENFLSDDDEEDEETFDSNDDQEGKKMITQKGSTTTNWQAIHSAAKELKRKKLLGEQRRRQRLEKDDDEWETVL